MCVCVRTCARACVRACVHACVHACVCGLCTGLPGWAGTRTNLDFTEARDGEWQWHQLGYMQICTWPQTDNHACTQPLTFSALTLLIWQEEGHPSCKKLEWWDVGMVIWLGQDAGLHMAQLIPLLPVLTVCCSRKSRLVLVLAFWYRLTQVVSDKIQRAVKWL